MLSLPPHLLELHSDLVERLRDHCNEHVLHHPGEEEDHGDKVEGGLPWVKRVSRPVHDVDPALLAGRLVHREHAGGKLSESREANLGARSVCQVHALEPLSTSLAVAVLVVWVGIDPEIQRRNETSRCVVSPAIAVRDSEVIDGDILGTVHMLPNAVAVQIPKELNAKEAVENPEEDEEEGDIVDLLAGPLEDLVEAGLGHGEAETGPDEPDHDERPRRSADVERRVVEAGELNAVENINEMMMPVSRRERGEHWTDTD